VRVACLLLMLLLPRLGAGAPAEPVDENTASLIAQLSPDTDDKVRLEAVLLLGKVGSLPALRAVAEAFRVEAEPLVAASAAQVLGKSGDARWIQVLGTRQKDPQHVVSAAARLWARKLAEGFARGKGVPEGTKRWVDLAGLDARTGDEMDFELANRYRDALAERLMKVKGVQIGVEIEFDEADVMGDAKELRARFKDVPLDERVPLAAEGAITRFSFKRGDDHADATVAGKLRLVVLPGRIPLGGEASASASWSGPIDDPDAEDADLIVPAIEALVDKLYARMGPAIK
jgi:hypothetical protein